MPGSLHLIRPRTRHDYATTAEPGRWGFHWAWFTPQAGWLPWLDWGAGAGGVSALSPGPEAFSCIAGAMAEAVRHACSGAPCSGALAANSIERALILARSADAGAGLDVRVRRALAILHQEPDGDLSLARLAVRCQTSVSRLTAAFRSAMGVSVHAYREHLRLARAERLLRHSRLSISAIAEACGYPDPFHFSRRFRRHAGMSPRVWRSQAQA